MRRLIGFALAVTTVTAVALGQQTGLLVLAVAWSVGGMALVTMEGRWTKVFGVEVERAEQ